MLRSPQYLVLQLSVAPTRRTLTTAAASSYNSEKSPPPPPPPPPPSHHPHNHNHNQNQNQNHVHAAAAPANAATIRVFRLTSEPNVAARNVRRSTMSQSQAQPRSHSEERSSSHAEAAQQTRTNSRLTSYFPLGYRDAVHQWWTSVSASAAERGVLAYVPFVREAKAGSQPDLSLTAQQQQAGGAPLSTINGANAEDPYGPRLWRSQMVALSGKNRALNEYSIERVGEETEETLVMLHGYGAGLGFFYRNFEPLSRRKGWRLYALDMLGMGNSSRPPFKVRSKDPQAKITEAESWFIDSLEEWRKIRKIERFTLMGHSMGGYLAVSYALKYPGRLNKLILASPVGVPEDPYAVNSNLPEPNQSTLASEFTQDQDAVVEGSAAGIQAAAVSVNTSATPKHPSHDYTYNQNHHNKKKAAASTKPERRPLPGWLVWLWDANVSPFSLVRASGPLGPRLVSGWTSRRFSHLDPEEADALHTYTYNLFRQRGSGEYALPYLLAPGAYARSPVINRIQNVGRQVVQPAQPATATTPAVPEVKETGFPIVMMYGDHDWMDVAGGYAAEEKIKKRIEQVLLHGTPEEQKRENGSAKVLIVRNAGHHLYLDNPEEFNKYIDDELAETQRSERRRRLQAGK